MWVSTLPRSRNVVAYAPRYRRTPMVSTNAQLGWLGAPGSTVASASKGASVGASIGSALPIVGTAVGAIIGGVVGAIASAFNRQDQEVQNFNQAMQMADSQGPSAVLNIANKYLVLAGLFDLQPGQIKGNIPIYKKYGRMGEQRFVSDLMTLVYQSAQTGLITPNDTPQSIMSRIVQPWIDSFGYGPIQDHNAQMLNMILMGMISEYAAGLQTRWSARGGDFPFKSLPPFGFPMAAPAPQQAPQPVQQAVQVVAAPAAAVAAVTAAAPVTTSSSGGPIAGNPAPPMPAGYQVASTTPDGRTVIGPNGGLSGQLYAFTNGQWLTYSGPLIGPAPQSTGAANMGMPTVVPVPVSAAGQVDMQGLVQQLLAQGQSQQQAFNSAMASMQAAGVQPTPQVQQATAQAVQAQTAGAGGMFSGMSSMGGIAIVAAMALASFALARPVGRTPSRRRS
jgi:hypothetical protein